VTTNNWPILSDLQRSLALQDLINYVKLRQKFQIMYERILGKRTARKMARLKI